MIAKRIKAVLTKIGFTALPESNDEELVNYGLNSLTLALLIITLEKEFTIKIPLLPIEKNRFITINTLALYIKELEKK